MAKIKHIAVATQDPEKTANFYKEVFDLQEVGRVSSDNAEGYYLSDGNINLAILKFKNEEIVGDKFDTNYCGIHHIGFEVEDAAVADEKLRKANAAPMDDINAALHAGMGTGHGGWRNDRYISDGVGRNRAGIGRARPKSRSMTKMQKGPDVSGSFYSEGMKPIVKGPADPIAPIPASS